MAVAAAITGIGAVTPCGASMAATWAAVLAGRTGTGPITAFSTEGYRVHHGAQVSWPGERSVYAFAAAAMAEALAGAGLPPERLADAGLVFGSNQGEIGAFEAWCADGAASAERALLTDTCRRLLPALGGPRLTLSTACATGANALGLGLNWIRLGRCGTVIAGAADVLTPFKFSGHHALGSLSPGALLPFHRERSGTVLGEGACFLVLESVEQARQRGARIYAWLSGYGASADAHHPVAPDPTGGGQALAIVAALRDAGLPPSAVDLIHAHGTGTEANDRAEVRALEVALGAHAARPYCVATKGSTGHMLGATAALEAGLTALMLRHGVVPPTAGLTDVDPACRLNHVVGAPVRANLVHAVSNAFGFGGNNACLVLSRAGEGRCAG